MGQGATMTVANRTNSSITLAISGINCMHDKGAQGSNLQLFNGATIGSGQSLPSTGSGQYIEAEDSGSCFFEQSNFTLGAQGIGSVQIVENEAAHSSGSNSNPTAIQVDIVQSGDIYVIQINIV